jgi:hypothetical protein
MPLQGAADCHGSVAALASRNGVIATVIPAATFGPSQPRKPKPKRNSDEVRKPGNKLPAS